MKHRFTILLAVLILLTGVTLGAQAQKIEINFWSLFTGGDGEFFDGMVKEFNASQNEIIMKTDTVKFDNYYIKLTAALAAKNAPDVVVMHQDRLSSYVPSGSILPLNNYVEKVGVDMSTFEQAPLSSCTFDGKIYAIPMDVHPLIMYYNTALFEKAGLAKAPESLEELFAAAQTVQEKTGAIGISADNTTAKYKAYTLTRMFMSMLKEQGFTTLDATNTKANFNNAAGAKAYQALSDMVNKYNVTPKQLDYDSAVANFKLGKAGIHFNGVWVTGTFEQQPGLKFAAVKFPALFGANASWAGSHTFAIPAQKTMEEKRILAAVKFIDWMTTHGYLWAKAGHVPTRKTAVETAEFKSLPYRSGYSDASKYTFPPPDTPKWPQCYDAISDSLEESIALNRDAKTALATMEQVVNAILTK